MSHPKGERARLDTLPQRLSGWVRLTSRQRCRMKAGKATFMSRARRYDTRSSQRPGVRSRMVPGPLPLVFVAMLHTLRLVEHSPVAIWA